MKFRTKLGFAPQPNITSYVYGIHFPPPHSVVEDLLTLLREVRKVRSPRFARAYTKHVRKDSSPEQKRYLRDETAEEQYLRKQIGCKTIA